MSRVTQIRLALAAIGVLIWAYGYRIDETRFRWIGIAFLVAALLLRFAQKRGSPPDGTDAAA